VGRVTLFLEALQSAMGSCTVFNKDQKHTGAVLRLIGRAAIWLLTAALLLVYSQAEAALSTWRLRTVGYAVIEQPLKQVLDEIAFASGMPMNVGKAVDGKVRARRLEGSVPSVLDQIATEYNLIWFSDGSSLYVERAEDSITQVFRLQGTSKDKVQKALASFELDTMSERIFIADDASNVRVNGPETLTKLVEAALNTINKEPEATEIEVIRFGQKGTGTPGGGGFMGLPPMGR
jgi:type III secretion protein C